MLKAGIRGILPREADTESIATAIHAVVQGLFVSDPSLGIQGPMQYGIVYGAPSEGVNRTQTSDAIGRNDFIPSELTRSELTRRELEVLALVAAGHPNKTIALPD